MNRSQFSASFVLCLLVLVAPARAQTNASLADLFVKRTELVLMRDGVRLNTEIYLPRNHTDALPMLMTRTPYGLKHDTNGFAPMLRGGYKELADDGYIFVFQDIRGRHKSEGEFVMLRPPRDKKDPKAIDESTDTYDTIDWLLKNAANNNGRVGVLGVSYGGWLATMAMLDPHPALKAVSEQASPADMFLGDDFHHNGAFRLSYGFEYAALLEMSAVTNTQFKFDKYDTYEWYLNLGPLANANKLYFHEKLPTWNDFVKHPNYDWFWRRQGFASYLNKVTVPNLNVAGWWDQEDFYGPMKIYELLEKHDAKRLNFLVVGPWNHGGWGGEGSRLGKIEFGGDTALHYRKEIQAPWFAHWLKDRGKRDWPEAIAFQSGANRWEKYDAWPPRTGIIMRRLYFQSDGRLLFEAPAAGGTAFDSYVSDPAHPVPYRARPIEPTYYPAGSGWKDWLVSDQRFAHQRPDVLSWETAPLTNDVVVSGQIVANLFASTSGTDSDWIVKLIDVYPEDYPADIRLGGYQLMVANEVLRGRFRKSFEKPGRIAPDQVTPYSIDLHSCNHRFLKGHKIMVQVQSTWFPLIDRNPQKFVPNIFEARESDYQSATQRIFRSAKFPSNVELPVEVNTP